MVQVVLGDPELDSSPVHDNPSYTRANKALAFELCGLADEDLSLYFGEDRTDGISMLAALARAVLTSSATYVSALNDKFTDPEPVTDKTKLQHALRVWKTDYDELRAVGSAPSQQTALRSLRRLIGKLKPLHVTLEMVSYTHPNDVHAIYEMAERKAGEWALLHDTQTTEPEVPPTSVLAGAAAAGKEGKGKDGKKGKGKDAWIPCSFYMSGWCSMGDRCRFSHNVAHNTPGTPSGLGPANTELARGHLQTVFSDWPLGQ